MFKQFFVLISVLLFASSVAAQLSIRTQTAQSAQFSMEQQLAELNREISAELTNNQKTTVAVLHFEDLNGNVSDFGKFLAEELVTRLFKTKKLKLVDRNQVEKIVAEQRKTIEGVRNTIKTKGIIAVLTDELAKRIGNQLGVKAIVIGTATNVGKGFRINARIISTDTGTVISTAATTVAKDEEVCSLINCDNANDTAQLSPEAQPIGSGKSKEEKASTSVLSKEADFFNVELQNCRKSGATVMCNLTIVNSSDDARIDLSSIGSRPIMYDDNNNTSESREVRIANGGSSLLLVSGVKVKAQMMFNNISTEATQISLLRFGLRSYRNRRWQYSTIEFRNIPFDN